MIKEKELKATLKKIKTKKNAGVDGLSQEQLIQGSNTLCAPLTVIFNKSISEGMFPESWKEALVTPVLKKVTLKLKKITGL